jgi:hypothetical protein
METIAHHSVWGRRAWVAPLTLVVALLVGTATHAQTVALNAAGDIARCGTDGARQTAALLDRLDGDILALGDLAYERGSRKDFRACYDPTWGRFKTRTWPAPGNHEYRTDGAAGYFAYWGERAGVAGEGYYSFDYGAWHVISLNSSIDAETGSSQDAWLARDLAKTKARCILAFWHHPVFSSGRHGSNPKMLDLLRRLYAAGASIILAGHEHLYERFARQNPDGRADPARGIRLFTVGTGGAQRYRFDDIQPNSEVRFNDAWGVLRLELEPDRYRWAFIAVDGREIDRGRDDCVARPR